MKWKRLEDLVLRNHCKSTKQSPNQDDTKIVNLRNMYHKIVKEKGIKSVDKRIAYLGLNQ